MALAAAREETALQVGSPGKPGPHLTPPAWAAPGAARATARQWGHPAGWRPAQLATLVGPMHTAGVLGFTVVLFVF